MIVRKFGKCHPLQIGDSAIPPIVERLMAQAEMRSNLVRADAVNKETVTVKQFSHGAFYQRSVDGAIPQSLIASKKALMQICPMELGDRIRAAYEALGISQAEAARRCHMSPQRFGNYVTGKRPPDIHSIIRIADVLQTTPDALLGISGQIDDELQDILGRMLELEGIDPARAYTIAEAVTATQRVLKALPEDRSEHRSRMAAQAVWTARHSLEPDKSPRP